MTFRKIVSLIIGLSFIIVLISGFLELFYSHSTTVKDLHIIFGILFTLGAIFHLKNNFPALKFYIKSKTFLWISVGSLSLFFMVFYAIEPFKTFLNWTDVVKNKNPKEVNISEYEIIEMDVNDDIKLSIDLLTDEHYWHPQMAIWIEDSLANYSKTIFVSQATAQGLFFGGRSKTNFKSFNESTDGTGDYRRVNALPIWSHKRNVKYKDGLYVPSNKEPLPDAITGETIKDNFKLFGSVSHLNQFSVFVEINVAFDDNEHYSSFDFPDDEVFHSGTGQLGQPSILFEAKIDLNDAHDFYLMKLVGHGHQSGQSGEIFTDLSTLTTAKEIVKRIVVGIE